MQEWSGGVMEYRTAIATGMALEIAQQAGRPMEHRLPACVLFARLAMFHVVIAFDLLSRKAPRKASR